MCNIWNRGEVNSELTLDEIKEFFKKSNFFSWINLSGGEIFLRPDIIDIFKVLLSANKKLYLLDFPTNGFIAEKVVGDVFRLLRFGPRKVIVTVSLDGPPQLHNEARGNSNSWDRALETFRELHLLEKNNRNLQVFFGYTIMPQNALALEDTFQIVRSKLPFIKRSHFHINIAHQSEHYYRNKADDMLSSGIETYETMQEFLKQKRYSLYPVEILERKYQRLLKDYLSRKKISLTCKALSSSCFIDPYGDVFPCSIYNQKIGNIRDFDFSLKKLWRSDTAKRIQKEIQNGTCPQCWTPCEAYQTLLGNFIKW